MLAAAGVVGIAIGFGSQKLVQDVIGGTFILFQDTMAVGDFVEVAGHSGVVEKLSLSTIHMRDLVGVARPGADPAFAYRINGSAHCRKRPHKSKSAQVV